MVARYGPARTRRSPKTLRRPAPDGHPHRESLHTRRPWTTRQWVSGLIRRWNTLPRGTTARLSERLAADPTFRTLWTLVRHFQTLVVHRRGEAALEAWCRAAEASSVTLLQDFARHLRQDWDAVVAAVRLPWSQGPVEGLNNRTKMLKRMMYGRAKMPLLRARILHGILA